MSHVRRNRKGERKKDVGISERRPTRSSHHGLRFAPHKRELTHKQPTTGLKHVSLSFWGERALPCLPSPALLLTSRFNLCLRPDSFGPWDLLCCWVPHGTRRERGLDDVLPLRSRATLIWESRPFFSRISYLADLVRVGRPVWKADIVCSGLFDELVFASIRAPCLETDLQFNSAKIYICIYSFEFFLFVPDLFRLFFTRIC